MLEEIIAIGFVIMAATLLFNLGWPLFRHISEEMTTDNNNEKGEKIK